MFDKISEYAFESLIAISLVIISFKWNKLDIILFIIPLVPFIVVSGFYPSRSNHQCSVKKKLFLQILQFSRESTCVGVSFLIKLLAFRPATLLKKTPIQVFSCEYCEIFQNTYFEKHLRTAAFLLLSL